MKVETDAVLIEPWMFRTAH